MTSNLKKLFKLLKIFLRYRFLLIHRKSIVLSSMPKSGTNYLRLILANYFYNFLRQERSFKKIEYDLMHKELFPNVRKDIFNGKSKYQKPKITLEFTKKTVYKDFMYDHGCLLDSPKISIWFTSLFNIIFKPKKTIFLYRNPYDTLISKFYFFHKNRIGRENDYRHARELISDFIPKYSIRYRQMKSASKMNENHLLISYEDLKIDPEKTISKLLSDLGIPIDQNVLKFSIDAASIDNVKQTENRIGKAIHTTNGGSREVLLDLAQ